MAISSALFAEINRLESTTPWVFFLQLTLTDGPPPTVLYLCRNNEDLVWNGITYTAIPFELEEKTTAAQGELTSLVIKIDNVTQVLQAYLEALNGGVGSTVLLSIVNTGLLAESYADLQMQYEIMYTHADAYWVSFTLGAPSLLRNRFPLLRFLSNHCNWVGASVECGVVYNTQTTINGVLTYIQNCPRTRQACLLFNNTARFTGFEGLQPGGIRVV